MHELSSMAKSLQDLTIAQVIFGEVELLIDSVLLLRTLTLYPPMRSGCSFQPSRGSSSTVTLIDLVKMH